MGDKRELDVVAAAGCVVYRPGVNGVEVLVAHRPRYDDWDLPKGKREKGESDLECAIRETEEETGFTGEIGDELASDHYQVQGSDGVVRDKVVRWWLLRCTGGRFVANDEVDEVRWLTPEAAKGLLTYEHARLIVADVPST